MMFTIISLNDERLAYKRNIRKYVGADGEICWPAVDGNKITEDDFRKRDLYLRKDIWTNPKRGELGVWLSNFDRWELAGELDEPLIVFEDDAVIDYTFKDKLDMFLDELPPDWDFAALWVPENQRADYHYNVRWHNWKQYQHGNHLPDELSNYRVNERNIAAKVYQGYGMVSLVYSPAGGRRLVRRARTYGITTPVDCWIYEVAHMGLAAGYAPHPHFADIVTYDWQAETHVQKTERY